MTVYAFHIFDRKGKTLFTKRYAGKLQAQEDADFVAEQRKLIFGMLFSLRELIGSLTPEDSSSGKLTSRMLVRNSPPTPSQSRRQRSIPSAPGLGHVTVTRRYRD